LLLHFVRNINLLGKCEFCIYIFKRKNFRQAYYIWLVSYGFLQDCQNCFNHQFWCFCSQSHLRDTGNPYFTTDTAAALRAVEIGAEVLLKATKVDGVYDADPMKDASATRYEHLGYQDLLRDQLKVLDAAAVSLCLENDLPIIVFDLNEPDNITRVARGDRVGTLISAHTGGVTR